VSGWIKVEYLLFCISELANTMLSKDIGILKDAIFLIFELPETFVAIRLTATKFISSLSKLLKDQ